MGISDRIALAWGKHAITSGRVRRPGKSVSLRSRFPGIEARIARRISTEMRHTARLIAADAVQRIHPGPNPVHLADEIHVEREAPASYLVVAGERDAYYGHILEHGSVQAAPRPFLLPALEAQKPDALARTRAILRGI